MAQYADPKLKWPYQQIHNPNRDDLGGLKAARRAAEGAGSKGDGRVENFTTPPILPPTPNGSI